MDKKENKGRWDEAIFCFVVIVLFLVGGYSCRRLDCAFLEDGAGRETRFHPFKGCFVKTDQGFIPENKWRPLDLKEVE